MWKSYIKPKTMKKITTFCLTALFIFVLSSCKNEPVKNKKETEPDRLKIVSLTPSITKQLNLLEVQDFVVGHTSYCPAKNLDSSEVVASATEVNIEKIATIKPDVVLVSTLTKQKVVKTLRKLNVKVKYLDMPGSFNEICSQLIKIGNIVNRKEEAEGIVKKQRTKLDSIRAKIPAGDTLKYFIEIGANPLFAATSDSFMHDYIKYVNGKNIAAGLKTGTISRENVLVKNPDVIIIVTMGIVGKEEKEVWREYPNLSANQKNKIFIIDSDKACSPTPVSFVEVTEKIVDLVYFGEQENQDS